MPIDPLQDATSLGRIIPEQPDLNTSEIATYGSAYARVKSALWVVDKMIEIAEEKYIMAIASCYGDEYDRVMKIFRTRPLASTQERPRSRDFEDLMALQKAKEIYRRKTTIDYLKRQRREIDAYGAINGIQEYGNRMLDDGISLELIRRVIRKRASAGMVNTYESVKAFRNDSLMDSHHEEERRMERMADLIMRTNEQIRMMDEFPEEDVDEWDSHDGWNRTSWTDDDGQTDDEQQVAEHPRTDLEYHIDPSVGEGLGRHVSEMDESEMVGFTDPFAPEPETEHEEVARIGPGTSTPAEAIGSVVGAGVPEETARIPPVGCTPSEALATTPETEEIARIGPDSNSPRDVLELMESLFLQRPPCDQQEYADWYRRKMKRDHNVELDYQDDGGIVYIQEVN